MNRYYLTEEREVTKEQYVAAERRAGFYNTLGRPEEPATASFSSGKISGRIAYCSPERRAADELAALTEELGLYDRGGEP